MDRDPGVNAAINPYAQGGRDPVSSDASRRRPMITQPIAVMLIEHDDRGRIS
jgi:hypothetical protein